MRVKLINAKRPPKCQGNEHKPKNLKLWQKIKGMEIKVRAVQPNEILWDCGTDQIFRIDDPEYYRRIGVTDSSLTLFCCKHAVAEVKL